MKVFWEASQQLSHGSSCISEVCANISLGFSVYTPLSGGACHQCPAERPGQGPGLPGHQGAQVQHEVGPWCCSSSLFLVLFFLPSLIVEPRSKLREKCGHLESLPQYALATLCDPRSCFPLASAVSSHSHLPLSTFSSPVSHLLIRYRASFFTNPENLDKAKEEVLEAMREVLARPEDQSQEEEQVEEQAATTSSTNILAGITKKMKLNYSKKVGNMPSVSIASLFLFSIILV